MPLTHSRCQAKRQIGALAWGFDPGLHPGLRHSLDCLSQATEQGQIVEKARRLVRNGAGASPEPVRMIPREGRQYGGQ
jgi:hypothetical protein